MTDESKKNIFNIILVIILFAVILFGMWINFDRTNKMEDKIQEFQNQLNNTLIAGNSPEFLEIQEKECLRRGYFLTNSRMYPTKISESPNGITLLIYCFRDEVSNYTTDGINFYNKSTSQLTTFWVQIQCISENCEDYIII